MFQSTPPARAATSSGHDHGADFDVSIHAARAGGDSKNVIGTAENDSVSIHAARAGGDSRLPAHLAGDRGFNPRRPRGRRLTVTGTSTATVFVSIHAARAGGDRSRRKSPSAGRGFNPRRPRGRRQPRPPSYSIRRMFQSTPPARAATGMARRPYGRGSTCFNPRRPRGRRPGRTDYRGDMATVSIHAARAGGDPLERGLDDGGEFQSTPPARAATIPRLLPRSRHRGFNPRRPRGRRLIPR